MTAEFDAIKIKSSQDRDGHVVVFRINADDAKLEKNVPFLLAWVGSQFRMTAIPLDDDGNPSERAL